MTRFSIIALLALALACGDDDTTTVIDMGFTPDAEPMRDAGPDPRLELEARAQRVVDMLQPWAEAGWYDTFVIGVLEGDATGFAGYGIAEDGTPVGADSVYEIGSITKTFAGLLLADAIERGEVALDDPLTDLLPGAPIPVGPASGDPIRLEHLATHTSGLPTFPDDIDFTMGLDAVADYDATQVYAWLEGFTLPRNPGQGFEYSNMAVGLLGYGLAESQGTTFGDLLQERVLDPMGLEHTTLEPVAGALLPRDHALEPVSPLALEEVFTAAGELRSTARDMLRYARFQLHPEELEGTLAAAVPTSQQGLFEYSADVSIAYNWFRVEFVPRIEHSGGTIGMSAFLVVWPEADRALIVLTNVAGHRAIGAHYGWASAVANEEPVTPTLPPDTFEISDTAVFDDYVGTYDLMSTAMVVRRRGTEWLEAQLDGQPSFLLFPTAEDTFELRAVEASIVFQRGADDAVHSLVLHQNGMHVAPRVD